MNANSPTAPEMVVAQSRTLRALEMREAGKTYQAIADELGMTVGGAFDALKRGIEQRRLLCDEKADIVRDIELQRLDFLLDKAMTVINRFHVHVVAGTVVKDDNGERVENDAPVLAAIDRVLKIQERRARLLGLDAPERKDLTTHDRQVILYVPDNGREAPEPAAGQGDDSAGRRPDEV